MPASTATALVTAIGLRLHNSKEIIGSAARRSWSTNRIDGDAEQARRQQHDFVVAGADLGQGDQHARRWRP